MADVGQKAPVFTLKNQDQKEVALDNFKKVLIAFFPFAFSPVCTNEMICFKDDLSQFRQTGTDIIGISVDSHWTQRAFANSLGVEYDLLSDFNKQVSKDYGVLRKEGFSERAYFVVEKGIVKFKKVMENPATKIDDKELFNALK